MRRFLALFLIFLFVLSAVPVSAQSDNYILKWDSSGGYVEADVSNIVQVVDDEFTDLSTWTVVTKTEDTQTSIAQSTEQTIRYSYSLKFSAYLNNIATNGYDWNDVRQANYMDWSDAEAVAFFVYIPDNTLNTYLHVGFYDSDGTEGWKCFEFSDFSVGWNYVLVKLSELSKIANGDGVLDFSNAKLAIRIYSSDASLDGTTVSVYIDYIMKIKQNLDSFTMITVFRGKVTDTDGTPGNQYTYLVEQWAWLQTSGVTRAVGLRFQLFDNGVFRFLVGAGTTGTYKTLGDYTTDGNEWVAGFGVYDADTGEADFYVNGQLISTATLSGRSGWTLDYISLNSWKKTGVTLAFFALYNRPFTKDEVENFDFMNPPTDGLLILYTPDSVDVTNNVWRDKSGLGNDGTIVGATAERVSIPKLYVYDANLNPIPYMDVSVTLIANNTTTGLIPSMPVLPYNETVTLNVSAKNYESRLLTIMSTVSTISVYLKPLQTQTTETDLEKPPLTSTNTLPSTITIDDYGFKGAKLGELFIQGKWSDVYEQFWYYDSVAEIALPILFSLGLIIAGFIYTRNPLVPIGVTAITMTFFHELGLSLSISLIAPLASLFVFFVVWTLWDFYKRFERS